MEDSNYSKAEEIGYSKGFEDKAESPEIDFFRVKNTISKEAEKEVFEAVYRINFAKGKKDRKKIYRTLKFKFGEISESENYILSIFFEYICQKYWKISQIFKSWIIRVNYEFGIHQINKILSLQIIEELLKKKKLQKAIFEIKRYSLFHSDNKTYFQILLKDLSLKVARNKNKKKQISSDQYRRIVKTLNSEILEILEKAKK